MNTYKFKTSFLGYTVIKSSREIVFVLMKLILCLFNILTQQSFCEDFLKYFKTSVSTLYFVEAVAKRSFKEFDKIYRKIEAAIRISYKIWQYSS